MTEQLIGTVLIAPEHPQEPEKKTDPKMETLIALLDGFPQPEKESKEWYALIELLIRYGGLTLTEIMRYSSEPFIHGYAKHLIETYQQDAIEEPPRPLGFLIGRSKKSVNVNSP